MGSGELKMVSKFPCHPHLGKILIGVKVQETCSSLSFHDMNIEILHSCSMTKQRNIMGFLLC